jgi:hypothetical protein
MLFQQKKIKKTTPNKAARGTVVPSVQINKAARGTAVRSVQPVLNVIRVLDAARITFFYFL